MYSSDRFRVTRITYRHAECAQDGINKDSRSVVMPDSPPYVHCPSCGCRFVPDETTSASLAPIRNVALNLRPLVLHSWKEIASYIGSGVRTAQRWERELDLPVRRMAGRTRTSVMAFPEDIDAWLHRAPTAIPSNKGNGSVAPQAPQAKHCA